MKLRRLGRSGYWVSPICLGTMCFGDRTTEADAQEIVAAARDAGVNFIDTADVYNDGRSEEIVGRAITQDRDRWVLATKVGHGPDNAPERRGCGRRWIMTSVDRSLTRLGTDWIDLYYLHREDHGTPLEETVSTLGDLMRQGKIRAFGLSNYRAWRIAEIVRLCEMLGVDRPAVNQPYYNAVNRMPEVEQLPACGHFGIGVVPYSPLARGVLTGKYGGPADNAVPDDAVPDSRRGVADARFMETEWRPESLTIAARIADHARRRGMTPGQFAFNWVLNNRMISAAIAGPRTLEQWHDYAGALDHDFTAEDEAFIDALVPKGHPSTPGYSDPAYPIEGRVPSVG